MSLVFGVVTVAAFVVSGGIWFAALHSKGAVRHLLAAIGAVFFCSSATDVWQKIAPQAEPGLAGSEVAEAKPQIAEAPPPSPVIQEINRTAEDDAAWGRARNEGTIAGYERYLEQRPNGQHTAKAEVGIMLARERQRPVDPNDAWLSGAGPREDERVRKPDPEDMWPRGWDQD